MSTTTARVDLVKPGLFGSVAAADSRRGEFDIGNEIILSHGIPVDFVFIGDSITHMWDVYAYFGRSGQFVVNRGIGGDISEHVSKRFAADVVQLKPKHVVIKIGINNFWALDGWTAADRRQPKDIIPGVVKDITAMVKEANANQITPIVCSILPTNIPASAGDVVRNEAVRATNAQLAEMAKREGAIYVDYHSHMTTEDGSRLRAELADDGLHPHVLGYDIMADVLRTELNKHGITL
ncbi:GDSL-type esterase/lipase family protein [Alicyclobacillus fodiniaquatilis]|uniref:GDSL-type esterase/lipase family protein n=1 Tax=Alicyclobacillus fodiniaquatilis TaxID=1661150 RepID=A0ABW4JMF4_9BACL